MSFDRSSIVTNRVAGQGIPAADNNAQGVAILDLDDRVGTDDSTDPESLTYKVQSLLNGSGNGNGGSTPLTPRVFFPESYGAVGNAAANMAAGSAHDDTAAIQAAVNAAIAYKAAHGGGVEVLLTKLYRVTGTITGNAAITIRGLDSITTGLVLDFASGDALFFRPDTTPPSNDPQYGLVSPTFQKFGIWTTGNRTSGAAIRVDWSLYATIRDVKIRNYYGGSIHLHHQGIVLNHGGCFTIDGVFTSTHYEGIRVTGTDPMNGDFDFDGSIVNSQLQGTGDVGDEATGARGIHIAGGCGGVFIGNNCDIAGQRTALRISKDAVNQPNREVFVDGTAYFDDNRYRGVDIKDGSLYIFLAAGFWASGNGRHGSNESGRCGIYIGSGCQANIGGGGKLYANAGDAHVIVAGMVDWNAVRVGDDTDTGQGVGSDFIVVAGGSLNLTATNLRGLYPAAHIVVQPGASRLFVMGCDFLDPSGSRVAIQDATNATTYKAAANLGLDDSDAGGGTVDPPPVDNTTYLIKETFLDGAGSTVTSFDTGGAATGSLVATETGGGYAYPTTTSDGACKVVPVGQFGIVATFTMRATAYPGGALGFVHCFKDANNKIGFRIVDSVGHFTAQGFRFYGGVGVEMFSLKETGMLSNGTPMTFRYTLTPDGKTHTLDKYAGGSWVNLGTFVDSVAPSQLGGFGLAADNSQSALQWGAFSVVANS
jgi:hypothetical protein